MLEAILFLILGLIGLVFSADKFVFGAAALAKNLGLSSLIIGLTIVAMGSSAPEMMVAATAALDGKIDTAIGNAIGSNITNITLVLGLTAILKVISVSSSTLKRELPLVFVSSVLAIAVIYNQEFTRLEGIMLLIAFFATIGYLTWRALKKSKTDEPDLLEDELSDDVPEGVPMPKALFWLAFGLILLPLSSNLLVDSAVTIAKYYGLSDLVIGLTIIAIGTSLPELAASIAGVMKGEDDLALGNIVGSNIFNALAVVAIPGIIAPGVIDPSAVNRDGPIMLGVTLLMILMAVGFSKVRNINRLEGALLLACFIGYQYLLFFHQA
ncbi:calcium/sodium antiporter [Saccharobesus litoralis]|uniref:Calcium/sodium antiporter n=1 Tax=Saccharobesus litoralis TaxID=2172099 RepID=A0A2S0VWT3_9ALTE|nr:calcium/sodium antiporter [Saccharobesus litoralis]AWB68645.1 calcium/sodium antiporter [Saccharobesus litoralis]